jgi:hypothetical protein
VEEIFSQLWVESLSWIRLGFLHRKWIEDVASYLNSAGRG